MYDWATWRYAGSAEAPVPGGTRGNTHMPAIARMREVALYRAVPTL
jgi:hypothetical protein